MPIVRLNLSTIQNALTKLERINKKTVKIGINSEMQYANGTKVEDVANILENGWIQTVTAKQSAFLRYHGLNTPPNSTLICPPRPFFSVTVKNKADKWQRIGTEFFITRFDIDNLEKVTKDALQVIGQSAVADIQDVIYDNDGITSRADATLKMLSLDNPKTEIDSGSRRTQALYKSGLLFNSIAFEMV